MCLPVYIDHWKKRPGRKVMIRFPLPYKVGELNYPGNANEKVRCEAATYVWIRENCPDVPIPHLWGFAFAADAQDTKGYSFIALDGAPLLTRLFETLRRQFSSLLGHNNPFIDYLEETDGTMLSASWESYRKDDGRLANLFQGLSRIMLALGNIPLPLIGSFTMDNDGVVRLANRPLTLQIHQLENGGIPTKIDRDTTYATTECYFLDVLSCHDNHLTHQLNAINDESDCRSQMAALATIQTVLPRFIRHDLRRGPFLLTLTDVHQSNIFVDDEWNIKYIIDLEWACSLPMEMQHPPYWLMSQAVDGLADEELALFEVKYSEFHRIFAREEALQGLGSDKPVSLSRACTMQEACERGNFFYFLALDSISGLYGIFIQHLQPRFADHFADGNFERIVSSYWCSESQEFVVGV
ncbi:hypothetical protein VE04_03024 [Pseudogymnoascus sp. 24MN13]|nr:hypothetical protein VE04_03024 [Pseudogymnoascus sp. 24MN13]